MNESEFLARYDKNAFESPLVSVDSVLFTCHENRLKVLLVKRDQHPDTGKWGLPGGFIDEALDTTLEDTVRRKLLEKTGVAAPYIEQLRSYGSNRRDKRGWAVTVCFSALVAHQECEAHVASVSDAHWHPLEDIAELPLAFDHGEIIEEARKRLKQKALYSIVTAYALPEQFTLPELQQLHEILIGKPIQKKSFRRRIEQAELLIDTGIKRSEGGRPASLYTLKESSAEFTFLRNLEM